MSTNSLRYLTEKNLRDIIGPAALAKPGSAMRSRQDNIIYQTVTLVNAFAPTFELDKVTYLSKFLGQIAVECDYFRTTTEYASGKAYEGRKDLGNTQPGDGPKFRGHGLIQTTGRDNHAKFTKWAKTRLAGIIKEPIPDFVAEPEKLALFPWAFFSAAYFWSQGNRTGKSLNVYARDNNDEMITRIINGGLNHFGERVDMTFRAGLVLLGYPVDESGIRSLQMRANRADPKIKVDGIVGAQTRAALHRELFEDDRLSAVINAQLAQEAVTSTRKDVADAIDEIKSSATKVVKRESIWLLILGLIFGMFKKRQ